MKYKRYTDNDWKRLISLYEQLGSWNKVMKETGISPTTLAKAKKKGLIPNNLLKINNNINNNEAQELYNSGLTLVQLALYYNVSVGVIRGLKLKLRNYSEASIIRNKTNVRKHSKETKELLSFIMSTKMANRKVASKRYKHKNIILESSWEKLLAEDLDANNIKWERPNPIIYNDDLQIRRYYPDFYLPQYDLYLDPKNDYLQKIDAKKLRLVTEQNNINLLVLGLNELNWSYIKRQIKDNLLP